MSKGYFPISDRKMLYLDQLFLNLITASHILHKHDIFDAYGHVSVRNPDNLSNFFMSSNMAPALLKSADEIVEYKVEDAAPVNDNALPGFVERYIHSEIYKKFPNINAVVHSHCQDVLPYCISDIPLRPTIHMGGFLGAEPSPLWDINSMYSSSSDERHDLLVRSTAQGQSLADAFKPATSAAFIMSKVKSALPTQLGGISTTSNSSTDPLYRVVLMRGHGFTTAADSLEAVVFQAVYTKEVAKVQTLGLLTSNAYFGASFEGKLHLGDNGNGVIKDGKIKSNDSLKYLNAREAAGAWQMNKDTMMRPWNLWVREVQVDPLYKNTVTVKETGS